MTTQVATQAAPIARPNLLRYTLRGNAIVSAACGVLCLADAQPLAALTGITPSSIFSAVGMIMLVYAAALLDSTSRRQIDRRMAIATVVLDTLWVIASVALLVEGWSTLTSVGVWVVAIQALGTAAFADLQLFGVWRVR